MSTICSLESLSIPPPLKQPVPYYVYILFYCDIECEWGSSCFVVVATVTCALCLIAQTLQRLPVPFTFLSAAAPVWGWTFRSLCLSTLPWLPSTKVSSSNIAWCLFIDVLCCCKILYFKGFVYLVLKTSETLDLYMSTYMKTCMWCFCSGLEHCSFLQPFTGRDGGWGHHVAPVQHHRTHCCKFLMVRFCFHSSLVEIMEKNVLFNCFISKYTFTSIKRC